MFLTMVQLPAGATLERTQAVLDRVREHYLVNEKEIRPKEGQPLAVPEGAVVVPGSRPAPGSWARVRGLSISSAVVVKYRDAKTDARTALEPLARLTTLAEKW